jgi:hypothetical protein
MLGGLFLCTDKEEEYSQLPLLVALQPIDYSWLGFTFKCQRLVYLALKCMGNTIMYLTRDKNLVDFGFTH